MNGHPADYAAPPYKGLEAEIQKYPRVYVKDHPWIDYYRETSTGIYYTPKISLEVITIKSVITKEGATFAEIVGNYNEKTNSR